MSHVPGRKQGRTVGHAGPEAVGRSGLRARRAGRGLDEVHPDNEDGCTYDHDEGPNGCIYIEASTYFEHYDIVRDLDSWEEDFMYIYYLKFMTAWVSRGRRRLGGIEMLGKSAS